MGKAESERLNQKLSSHMSNIHETMQILDHTPSLSLEKSSWDQAIQMGELISKHATTAGMLFTEVKAEVKGLEENMEAYFNGLQGLLLLGYGSTVGAGPTLKSSIHESLKQVVSCSFTLWTHCVSSYVSRSKEENGTIPQYVGMVWDACSALKKTPATNIIAIGREMTRVAVSIKDVLREIKELEPCSSDATCEVSEAESQSPENDNSDDEGDEDDLGKDLSPEEMKVAQLAVGVVSGIVVVIKELIRCITSLLKKGGLGDERVESLENLLGLCRGVGVLVDELGACLYPPQEFSAILKASENISTSTDEMHKELERLDGSSETFLRGSEALKGALKALILEISDAEASKTDPEKLGSPDLVSDMKNLALEK